MKKLQLVLLFLVIAGFQLLHAQGVQIIGKVTGSEDGQPIVGATVQVKGTTIGTVTDYQGKYVINVPAGATSLVFSFVGLMAQEVAVAGKTTIDVIMQPEVTGMQEVVVTAFGIKRSAKELGYSTAKVSSKEINEAGATNVVNGLSGKVSGLQINTINNGVNPDTRITLRGNRHITSSNQALVVLDGVPVSATYLNSINPNDIESVNILKGASASALYGNEASNGVVVVTTKKGGDRKPIIKISNTTMFERISYFPEMQTRFGGGSGEDTLNGAPLTIWTGAGRSTKPYTPYENQSYGPEYTGELVNLGGPLPDGSQQKIPYSYVKDNKKNFFVTGVTSQNDVSYSQGDENNSFYISAQDVNTKGIVPKDVNRRSGIRFAGGRTYNIFHAEYTIGYTETNTNVVGGGFFQERPVYWNVMNTPGQVPLTSYSDIVNNKFATNDGYFNGYYTNPYWQVNHSRQKTRTDDLLGSFLVSLKPTNWLEFSYRAGVTLRTRNYNAYRDDATTSDYYLDDPWASGGYRVDNNYVYGNSSDWADNNMILTGDFLTTLNKKFGEFSTKLILGSSIYSNKYRYISMSAAQLQIPNFYNISNRIGEASIGESKQQRNASGLFADLSLGYKEMIYLHGSLRNDKDSRLVEANRSFTYFGSDISILLTEAIPALKDNSFLSFAKLRAGYSKTGQVALNDYYATLPSYAPNGTTFTNGALVSLPGGNFPYGSTTGFSLAQALGNPTLTPEFTYELEGGLDLSFIQNRYHLEITGFNSKTIHQTIPATFSASTGYTSGYINAGELDNKGVEIDLKLTPLLTTGKFNWNLFVNYTMETSKLKKLLDDGSLTEISLGNNNFATVGQQFPLIKVTDYVRDSVGRIIVDSHTGLPDEDTKLKAVGHGNPNSILGIVNTFSYGGFTLSFVAEYRTGNVIYNVVGNALDFTGISWHSAINGRQPFVIPNSSVKQVDPVTHFVTYVPNTSTVVSDAGYTLWTNSAAYNTDITYVNSAAFWKLRELSLTYDLPVEKLWGGRYVKAAQIGLLGRNLLMWRPSSNKWADPEFNNAAPTQNSVGYTTIDQTPATRFYGFTVKLTF